MSEIVWTEDTAVLYQRNGRGRFSKWFIQHNRNVSVNSLNVVKIFILVEILIRGR